jgi:Protein of unknown function (DUF3040)
MALSLREQRILADIEAQFERGDSRLARRLSSFSLPSRRWVGYVLVLVWVLAAVLLVVGSFAHSRPVMLTAGGALVVVPLIFLARSPCRRRRGRSA